MKISNFTRKIVLKSNTSKTQNELKYAYVNQATCFKYIVCKSFWNEIIIMRISLSLFKNILLHKVGLLPHIVGHLLTNSSYSVKIFSVGCVSFFFFFFWEIRIMVLVIILSHKCFFQRTFLHRSMKKSKSYNAFNE